MGTRPLYMLRPTRQASQTGTVTQEFHRIPADMNQCIFIGDRPVCVGRRPHVKDGSKMVCRVPDNWQSVSGTHVTVFIKDGQVLFEDSSSNGTFFSNDDSSGPRFTRMKKHSPTAVKPGSFVMLAQWPNGRKADEVFMYKLEEIPPSATMVTTQSGSYELCAQCKRHTEEKLALQKKLDEANSKINERDKKLDGMVKAKQLNNKAMADWKADAADAQKAKESLQAKVSDMTKTQKKLELELNAEKKKVEGAEAKVAQTEKKLTEAEKKVKGAEKKATEADQKVTILQQELLKSEQVRGKYLECITGFQSIIKDVRELHADAKRYSTSQLEGLKADCQALVELMREHAPSHDDMEKEHEQELADAQEHQRYLQKESAAWRLKAELYGTKVPHELKTVLRDEIPVLVDSCFNRIQEKLLSLHAVPAAELLGTHNGNSDAVRSEDGGAAVGQSQRTLCGSGTPAVQVTPENPSPMACDGGLQTAACDSQGVQGPSASLRHMMGNGSQAATPGLVSASQGALVESEMVSPECADGASGGGRAKGGGSSQSRKREGNAGEVEVAVLGDGKRRRVENATVSGARHHVSHDSGSAPENVDHSNGAMEEEREGSPCKRRQLSDSKADIDGSQSRKSPHSQKLFVSQGTSELARRLAMIKGKDAGS